MPFDPFDVGEIDDSYTGTITDVVYEVGKYDFQAKITTRYDEPRTKNDGTMSLERTEFAKVAGLDQGFTATDDGAAFAAPEGKKVNPRSRYAMVVKRVKELCPNATGLVGLHVTWDLEGEGKPYSFEDKTTGEKKSGESKGKFMPIHVSMNGSAPIASEFDLASLDLTAEQMEALTEAAQAADTSVAFRAVALPHIMGNQAAIAALAGDGLWTTLRG